MQNFCYRLLLLIIISQMVIARPVSYPGGWTLMLMNDQQKNSLHLHYSPTAKWSLGYRFEHWRNKDLNLNAIQHNYLLQRWNNRNNQANVYIKTGLGLARNNLAMHSENQIAGFTGLAMDWESQRYFISYENRYTHAGDFDRFLQQAARFGWAPYVGDYGDLHTWLMFQTEHMPESDDKLIHTALLRFFKGVHLLEIGANDQHQLTFNYIHRY